MNFQEGLVNTAVLQPTFLLRVEKPILQLPGISTTDHSQATIRSSGSHWDLSLATEHCLNQGCALGISDWWSKGLTLLPQFGTSLKGHPNPNALWRIIWDLSSKPHQVSVWRLWNMPGRIPTTGSMSDPGPHVPKPVYVYTEAMSTVGYCQSWEARDVFASRLWLKHSPIWLKQSQMLPPRLHQPQWCAGKGSPTTWVYYKWCWYNGLVTHNVYIIIKYTIRFTVSSI